MTTEQFSTRNMYRKLATVREKIAPAASLVAGAALLSDGLLLMALGYMTLGVIVPLIAGVGLMALSLRWSRIDQWVRAKKSHSVLWRLSWIFIFGWAISVAIFFIGIANKHAPMMAKLLPAQAIVVLGSGSPGSVASPTLVARLNLALHDSKKNAGAVVLVSGGRSFRTISEAQVMATYLREQGLAKERILLEEASTSTLENLRFSAQVLADAGFPTSTPIHLITSDFHTLRAGLIARRAGYTNVETVGVETPLHIRYNAWLREYFAMVSGWLLGEY